MRKVKIALSGALVKHFQKGIEEVACYQIVDTEERVLVTLERKRLHLRFQIAVDVAAAAAAAVGIEVQSTWVEQIERVFESLELHLHSRNTERALVSFSRPPQVRN